MDVIGRGTWLDKVANDVIGREKNLGRSLNKFNVESGLGASGIPHVGSIGDAIRSHGIRLALEDLGYKSELIAFSDDLDGLRKVPEGFPKNLQDQICKPVSMIEDPFSCHDSYSSHMSSMLLDGLDRLGIEYTFHSGAEMYKSGLLNSQIEKIITSAKRIGTKISEMLGQKKFEKVIPYYPICKNCGRIYLAQTHDYIPERKTIKYRCIGSDIGGKRIDGCGHDGDMRVSDGLGKLSWKGEFAARWAALDIRFESYGKDISDSVDVNDWIADNILGFPHPYHVRYELFLDKSGKKISKSLGNVFTPQTWLRFGTPESILLLMFKRITGTRSLGVGDIPVYMDEVDELEDLYFGKSQDDNEMKKVRLRGLYEYIYNLDPPKKSMIHVPYRLLTQLASVAPDDDYIGYVENRLKIYRYIKESDEYLKMKIRLAWNWAKEFDHLDGESVTLTDKERNAISQLITLLSSESDSTRIQSEIFNIAKGNGIDPPSFFKTIYRILIGSDKGPRLGPYIVEIGTNRVLESFSSHLNN